jgi:TPR repeat protein
MAHGAFLYRLGCFIYSFMSHACKLLLFLALTSAGLSACTTPLNGPERAKVFNAATAAYDAGNYKAALGQWSILAQQTDPAAMRNMGHLYRNGLGVAKNAETARQYYTKAARLGFAPAQMNLAMMYLSGTAAPNPPADKLAYDGNQGLFWLERAAAGGYGPAVEYLRLMKLRMTPHNP